MRGRSAIPTLIFLIQGVLHDLPKSLWRQRPRLHLPAAEPWRLGGVPAGSAPRAAKDGAATLAERGFLPGLP
jgi:hypothetical protein